MSRFQLLSDAQWALIEPLIPVYPGGRPRKTDLRDVVDAIFYLLRTGYQWRQLPSDFPPWPTVHRYFRGWRITGVWVLLHRALYPQAAWQRVENQIRQLSSWTASL